MKQLFVLLLVCMGMHTAVAQYGYDPCYGCPPSNVVYAAPLLRERCANESFVVKGGVGFPLSSMKEEHSLLWDADMHFVGASGAYLGFGAQGTYTERTIPDSMTEAIVSAVGIHLTTGYGLNRCKSLFFAGTGFGTFGGVAILDPSFGTVGFSYGLYGSLVMNIFPSAQGALVGIECKPRLTMLASEDETSDFGYTHTPHFALFINLRIGL